MVERLAVASGTGNTSRTPLVDELCGDCRHLGSVMPAGPARDGVQREANRLEQSVLRIAIGGRLKAGKSTLTNALLGARLAPTHRNECTLISATFRYGVANQIHMALTDGSIRTIAGRAGGGVPDELPLGRDAVRHLVVTSPVRALERDYEFTDTPGRDSLSGLDDYAMESILDCDCLLLVMPTPGAGDEETLSEFVRIARGNPLSAANVIGVLSRIDQLDGAGDDVAGFAAVAERLARRAEARLSPLVSKVVPVFGLLAGTTRGQDFTERHAATLRRLAGAAHSGSRLLLSPEHFLEHAAREVPEAEVRELLHLLDMQGIRIALDAIARGVTETDDLVAELDRASGITALIDTISERFLHRADELRAGAALARLQIIASRAEDSLAAPIEALLTRWRRRPELQIGALAAVAQAIQQGVVDVDEAETVQVGRLLNGASPAERLGLSPDAEFTAIAAEAMCRVSHWRAKEMSASRRAEPHVVTVRAFYEHLHGNASRSPESGDRS